MRLESTSHCCNAGRRTGITTRVDGCKLPISLPTPLLRIVSSKKSFFAIGGYKESSSPSRISISISIRLSHSLSSFDYKQTMFIPLALAMAALASFASANPLTTPPSYLSPYPTPCSLTMCEDKINSCGRTYGGCYPACSGYPTPTLTDPGCDPSSSPVSPTYPDPRCSVTVTITVTEPSPYYPSGCSSSSTTTTYSSPAGPTGYEAWGYGPR